MEFWTAIAVLRRRWYVFVPTLLVFRGGCDVHGST